MVACDGAMTPANQKFILAAKVIEPVLVLALSPSVPTALRAQVGVFVLLGRRTRFHSSLSRNFVNIQAMYAIGDFVRSNESGQVYLAACQTPYPHPHPALFDFVLLAVSQHSSQLRGVDFALRTAATYAFLAYLADNVDGQLSLLATLTPPPPRNPNDMATTEDDLEASTGSVLIDALLGWEADRKDPYRCWFSSVILTHALHGNRKGKEMALLKNIDASGLNFFHDFTVDLSVL